MLQKIRDTASGWVAYVIVGLISVPFALWGLSEYFGGASPLVVAEVNGVEISSRAYQQEYQQQRQQLAEMFGGRIPSGAVDEQMLRDNALQTLIRRELIAQMAEDKGFRISGAAVANEIRSVPGFQRDGAFDAERYRQILESQRRSPAEFEARVAQAMLLEQFQRGYQQSAFLPDAMVEDFLRLRQERRQVSVRVLPAESYADQVQVSDEQIAAYHAEHGDEFRTPERMRLAYLVLDDATLAEQVSVTESDLRREYEQRMDRYTDPEERRASHILVRIESDADEQTIARAEARARDIRALLDDGGDFIQVAAEHSDDPLAQNGGGDLGFIARGDMDPALEGVLFTLREGDVSQPVRTRLGLQILKLTEIRPAVRQAFEEVRDDVEAEYRSRRMEGMHIELTERLMTESYEQPGSLDPAAEATGLEIGHTDWFSREGAAEGLASEREILQVAFSSEIREGRNSDLIDLADGRVAVIRLHEYQPAAPRPLEEVADEIRLQLVWEESRKLAQAAGEQLQEALGAGSDWDSAVGGLPGEELREQWVTRDSGDLPAAVISRVFTMVRPAGETPSLSGMSLRNGDYAVLALHGSEPGEVQADRLAEARQQLSGLYGGLEFEALYQALEAQAEIRIFRENL